MLWHVSRAGQMWGPYTWDTLLHMAATGQLLPGDFVCGDGRTWLPVTQVVALPTTVLAPPVERHPATYDPHVALKFRDQGRNIGYWWLFAALMILVGAIVWFGVQVDAALAGSADSVEKIERGLVADGVPADMAKRAAAGEGFTQRDLESVPIQGRFALGFVPQRLARIRVYETFWIASVGFAVSLGAAGYAALKGRNRLRRPRA